MTTVDLFVLAAPAVCLLGAFYSAGELTRRRMQKGGALPHRLLDDLRGLEDAFVDFFGSSKTSAGILSVLATHRRPLGFNALAEEVRRRCTSSIQHDEMPLMAIRAVLRILLFSRLARMSVEGFAVTDLGREVHRRMKTRRAGEVPGELGRPAEKGKDISAERMPARRQISDGHPASDGSSPWIGRYFEDPSVAAAINDVEERFGKGSRDRWPKEPSKPLRERNEAMAGCG